MRARILLSYVMILVALQGCIQVQKFRGPNGRPAYSMKCGTNLNACFQKAGEVCPKGYDFIDRSTGTAILPYQGSIMALPQHTLAIECKAIVGTDSPSEIAPLKTSCNKGDARGCHNLGVLYLKGQGVTQDYAQAATLFQQACDGGAARGCVNLGVLYEDGQGVTRDHSHAATLFQKACDAGAAQGCVNLGVLYEDGQGVKQDIAEAVKFYDKACDLGNQEGCDKVKTMKR